MKIKLIKEIQINDKVWYKIYDHTGSCVDCFLEDEKEKAFKMFELMKENYAKRGGTIIETIEEYEI
jgi:hypothetical protein